MCGVAVKMTEVDGKLVPHSFRSLLLPLKLFLQSPFRKRFFPLLASLSRHAQIALPALFSLFVTFLASLFSYHIRPSLVL